MAQASCDPFQLKPDYVYAYNNRGIVRWTLGDTEGALADYGDAIRLNPHDPLAHYNRALIRIQQQDYAAAIADYQKYLESGAGRRDGTQAEVENAIQQLREKLGAAGSR